MAAGPDSVSLDTLQSELAAARAERDAAQAREAALAEVLQAINASRGDLKPVFDLINERAMAMCEADGADLLGFKDGFATALALRNPTAAQAEFWKTPFDLSRGATELLSDPRTRHVADMAETPVYKARLPLPVMAVESARIRTLVQVPLIGDDGHIGQFVLYRRAVHPFSDKQIALVEAFAAQAALAIENARLVTEQREALEQQTATAEVLEVINASPGNLEPVIGAMLEKAMHLCEAAFGIFGRFDGKLFEPAVDRGVPAELISAAGQIQSPPPHSGLGRIAAGESVVQLIDLANTDLYRSGFVGATALVDIGGAKTAIFVALRKDGALLGVIIMYRRDVRAFSDKQVALLQNFAAQAVIAIENARLITEQREALEQQTATADILRVISQSPTDIGPVLDAVVKAATRFCGAPDAIVVLRQHGDLVGVAAHEGPLTSTIGHPYPADRSSVMGRTIVDGRTVHIPDVDKLDDPGMAVARQLAATHGWRAALSAPMLRDGVAVGCIGLRKPEVGPFSDRQIELLETFAAQAVIAIENVRLFTELRESLDQQTASAEVLRVISQSPTNVRPVLEVVVKAAQDLCGAEDVVISLRDGDELTTAAHDGPFQRPPPRRSLGRDSAQGRAMIDRTPVHLPDTLQLDPAEWSTSIALARQHGIRAILAAPMLREGAAIGTIVLRKREAGPFSPRQVGLLETFAAQAVIAIENVRLFTEQRELLEQQTATAEILSVISQSPTDVEPVMAAVARAAVRFCGAEDAHVFLLDGNELVSSAHEGPLSSHPFGYRDALDAGNTARAHTVLEARVTHLPDTLAPEADAAYRSMRVNSIQHGFRAQLNAPMLHDGQAIGCICLRRREPGTFTPRQIQLLETFAAQAVIAIVNVRLFTELRESLEQQTASADVLRVISRSPTSVQPVFDAIAESALRLLNGWSIIVWRYEGGRLYPGAIKGGHPGSAETFRGMLHELPPDDIFVGEAIRQGVVRQIVDVEAEPNLTFREMARVRGWRSNLAVPMMREGQAVGVFTLSRREPGAFSEHEIKLLQSFADQAVIAVENVRLFTELRESLEQQTATADILRVISQSPTDVQPVLSAVTSAALRFCGANDAQIALREGDSWFVADHQGPIESLVGVRRAVTRDTAPGRAIADSTTVHFPDVAALDPVEFAEAQRLGTRLGFKSALCVPMLRDGVAIGAISLRRPETGAFSDRQISMAEAFAAQAVIAIENVRLFTELKESLEQQTASAEILQVISRSPTDVNPVLLAVVKAAVRFCGTEDAGICLRDGDEWVEVAHEGPLGWTNGLRQPVNRQTGIGRALVDCAVTHLVDIPNLDPAELSGAQMLARVMNFRTALIAPMISENKAIGAVALRKADPAPFTSRQVELLETFAAQAVIALQNVRLFTELRESLDYQTATSEVLEAISRSGADLAPVLNTMLAAAARLCGVEKGDISIRRDGALRYAASIGTTPEEEAWLRTRTIAPDRTTCAGQALLERQVVHVVDQSRDLERTAPDAVTKPRTVLSVPLLREDEVIGVITLLRDKVEAFSERQIALIRTFAGQAVIAIENARLLSELRESLDQQTATAQVLQVINSTPGNVQPVFEVILANAATLCDAVFGTFATFDGERLHTVATYGVPEAFAEFRRSNPPDYGPGTGPGRLIAGEDCVHDIDAADSDAYRSGDVNRRAIVDLGGARTILNVAMRKDGVLLGGISIYRQEVRPFSDSQIALLQGFASQAVIAMENARLLGELTRREEELRVTFDHMGDGVVMFDAGLRLASWNRNFQELLDIPDSFLAGRPGLEDYVRLLVERGELGADGAERQIATYRERAAQQWSAERTRPDGRTIEVRNNPVPGGGAVLIYSDITKRKRAEVEIRAARDAAEAALERQTATADILKVIASSPTDVQPVLEAVAKAAVRFCGTTDAVIHLREGDEVLTAAHEGPLRAAVGRRTPLDSRTSFSSAIIDRRTVHFPDIDAIDAVKYSATRQNAAQFGFRAAISAPLLREGSAIGAISLRRVEPGAYTPQQIELIETFAAQAVIAIENVRLFTELRESLEQQTASAEILEVISQSPTDVAPVLKAVVSAARRFCGADDAMVVLREDTEQLLATHEGSLHSLVGTRFPLDRSSATGRATLDGETFHVPDVAALDPAEHAMTIELTRRTGVRALLAAPMLREGQAIGCVLLRRPTPGAFTPRQIELLETFAAQAVIAIENVRLFTELRDSLERLKAAQANLIQSEKMASLGQLTAGIAHEIKNPLNFVNNFASLSVELLDELREVAGPALATLDKDKRAELDETMGLLVGNLGKITEHGKRADGIVKSMLSHSRGGSGDWQASDVNALVEEALNLAYHGARAQDKEFNVTLERDFGKSGAPIEVVPQDVTRVFLNLFGNGFYAASKRRLAREPGFRPTLKVSTRETGDAVEVRVRDNGIGIAPEVRDKLFQPFFTTKPTGEGTGLGLSISYDIVTQQHGGTIEVESEVGRFTEFTVRLPRRRAASAKGV